MEHSPPLLTHAQKWDSLTNILCGFAGVRCDGLEDDADVLRQRLVQALAVPTVEEGDHRRTEHPTPSHPEMDWRKPSADELHLLDVAQLSLAQRVVVQLNGVGVFSVGGQVCAREGAQRLFSSNIYEGSKSVVDTLVAW